METKDTLSSCSDSEEQEIQQLQKQAKILKENSLNKLNALQTTTQHLLSSNNLMYYTLRDDFHRIFEADERTFRASEWVKRLNERKLQIQEYKVQEIQASDASSGDKDCSRIVSDKRDDQGLENQNNTSGDESSRSMNECNDKRTYGMIRTSDLPMTQNQWLRASEWVKRLNERKLQIQEYKVQEIQASDASSGDKDCSWIVSDKGDDQGLENQNNTSGDESSRQHSEQPGCIINTCVVEKADSNVTPDSPDMFDYDKLERKLNETLGLLAQKDIDIKEGLKLKACEILVVQEKHDELVKQSLLTKSHYEGLVKEKTKVITDLKLKEEKDIDKIISMENQLKFLNEIVYKRSQSIQTIHMLAPKCPTFNGRPTFANPMYLKKAQYEKPCLYEILHDQSDPANRLIPDREEILTLKEESRSKLNKDLVKPYGYIKLISLCEIFKPPTQEYQIQLAHANEIRKKMWRKSFVKMKPNIFKNIAFLPVSKSISKSRQAYNVMTNNINHLRELVDQAWVKYSKDHFRALTAQDMEILIKTSLMPLALKTQNDSFAFVHELKKEMHADLKYVESLENEIDKLESDKAEFSNMIASQVGVSRDLTKPATPHSWPQVMKSSFAKPYNVNALGPSRNSPEHVSFQSPRESVGSNDMVHNYYLEEAKKKAQLQKDKALNTKPSVQQSARLPNTANEPPRNQNTFLKSKDLACPTCKKCIYSANHDECILKYLSKIPIGQRFSPNKSYNVYLKTTPPRSGLTWKPTGRIFTQVVLKWIPIRKSVETRYNTNNSALPLGKETHNPKTVICANSSSLSACTSMASEPISSKGSSNDSYKDGYGDASFQLKSNSLPHAHAQTTKTYYKDRDSRIKKAQELKDKDFRTL
ncbi:hypothetical protein Tco_0099442 [Tanacetum coccineum]